MTATTSSRTKAVRKFAPLTVGDAMVGSDSAVLDGRRQRNVGHDLALLAFDMFIKESKHIALPLRHRKVNEIVSVPRGSTDRRINF